MCYSAMIRKEYASFMRKHGAILSIREYVDLYWRRSTDSELKIPKATDALFADPTTDEERQINTPRAPPQASGAVRGWAMGKRNGV